MNKIKKIEPILEEMRRKFEKEIIAELKRNNITGNPKVNLSVHGCLPHEMPLTSNINIRESDNAFYFSFPEYKPVIFFSQNVIPQPFPLSEVEGHPQSQPQPQPKS